mmetsp:Transcript_116323/g.329036  ORF Transcript_116323/g.329036 Transcript_116323/m.329036 type:complete len:204 (-) Transcript_116323:191-802(-)
MLQWADVTTRHNLRDDALQLGGRGSLLLRHLFRRRRGGDTGPARSRCAWYARPFLLAGHSRLRLLSDLVGFLARNVVETERVSAPVGAHMCQQAVIHGVQRERDVRAHQRLEAEACVASLLLLKAALEHHRVQADAVPHLVVLIKLAEAEQEENVPAQTWALHRDFGERIHRRRPYERALEDQAVVDETDVFRWLSRGGHLLA